MSSIIEIEAAIASLPERDRERLESWFIAPRLGGDTEREGQLSTAIPEADASPQAGKSANEVRSLTHLWASGSSSKNGQSMIPPVLSGGSLETMLRPQFALAGDW